MFDHKRKEEDESVTEGDSNIEESCLFIYFEGIGVRGRVFIYFFWGRVFRLNKLTKLKLF